MQTPDGQANPKTNLDIGEILENRRKGAIARKIEALIKNHYIYQITLLHASLYYTESEYDRIDSEILDSGTISSMKYH